MNILGKSEIDRLPMKNGLHCLSEMPIQMILPGFKLDIFFERINSAQQRSEGDGSGGRVAKFLAVRGEDIDIGFENTEKLRIIPDLLGKPPSMLGFNHPWRDSGCEFGLLFDFSSRRFNDHPVAFTDIQFTGGVRIDFGSGVGVQFTQ